LTDLGLKTPKTPTLDPPTSATRIGRSLMAFLGRLLMKALMSAAFTSTAGNGGWVAGAWARAPADNADSADDADRMMNNLAVLLMMLPTGGPARACPADLLL
jgi:hypothetical protein